MRNHCERCCPVPPAPRPASPPDSSWVVELWEQAEEERRAEQAREDRKTVVAVAAVVLFVALVLLMAWLFGGACDGSSGPG